MFSLCIQLTRTNLQIAGDEFNFREWVLNYFYSWQDGYDSLCGFFTDRIRRS